MAATNLILSCSLAAWTARSILRRPTCKTDAFLLGGFLYVTNLSLVHDTFKQHILPHLVTAGVVGAVSSLAVLGATAFACRALAILSSSSGTTTQREGSEFPELKPMLLPCQTAHTRFFPKTHSFRYSYLQVGIPVGWKGSIGGIVAADTPSGGEGSASSRSAWFSVQAEDYLQRGNGELGLRGKMDEYLVSQGAKPEGYPCAYLVTAPRVFGYSFNPISFWYLYSKEKELTAMILEVNNTFDERRMYFLPKNANQSVTSDGSLEQNESVASKVSAHWTKDFHVSPFNSRKGSYSVTVQDPFSSELASSGNINNIVTLHSSKDHVKLVATISSTAPAIPAGSMTLAQKVHFILSWWWVGFLTSPRILYQAGKLYFRKKLHVWFRPEVQHTSIGRAETVEEQCLAAYFRAFLKNHVENSTSPVKLRYFAAGAGPVQAELFKSRYAKTSSPIIDLKILTPAFYTEITRYAHLSEALVNLYLVCPELNKMLWISEPSFLHQLTSTSLEYLPGSGTASAKELLISEDVLGETMLRRIEQKLGGFWGWRERKRWELVRKLRRTPAPVTGKDGEEQAEEKGYTSNIEDIRVLPLSALDLFVIAREIEGNDSDGQSKPTSSGYLHAVLMLLLADRNAFGMMALLRLGDVLIRALLLVDMAGWASGLLMGFMGVSGGREASGMMGMVFAGLGVHLWDAGKWFVLG